MPAAEPLAQQAQNQATATAQATTSALNAAPIKTEVNNNIVVKNEPIPVVLEVDGEKLGEAQIGFSHLQEIRSGNAE
ncbi:MAG: hypothetical protein LBP72_10535 [Dysgonamonadaceae bacterium]|nr:hypothetical protein [Dysgonamonadaceae bacterium]